VDQNFDVAEQMAGGIPVLVVTGEIDVVTKPVLHDHLDAQLEMGRSTMVVDLRNVTFLDSTGLGVLIGALKRCREAGGDLRLVVDAPRILQLFTITGLDGVFAISPGIDGALDDSPQQERA